MRKVVVAAVAAAALGVACFPQGMCQTAGYEYCADGDPACQGRILDATHWESGPFDAAWLDFGAEVVIHVHMRDAVTGQLLSGTIVDQYLLVDATQTPNPSSGVFPAVCASNLCEIAEDQSDPSAFYLKNDTCSSEFVRAVVTVIPSASTDAGTE